MSDPVSTDSHTAHLGQWACPICQTSRRIFSTAATPRAKVLTDLRYHLEGSATDGHGPSGSLPEPYATSPAQLHEYITLTPYSESPPTAAAAQGRQPADD